MATPRLGDVVFVVQHVYADRDGTEHIKMIGVYRTSRGARAAVKRLADKPGFRRYPKIVDACRDENTNGFYITPQALGEDHWTEGFIRPR